MSDPLDWGVKITQERLEEEDHGWVGDKVIVGLMLSQGI